jgi:fibronectin-binding autotransporter adhesin
VTDHGEIDLTGTGVLKSGTLNASGQIKVGGLGNTLEGETVTNTGGIEVLGLGAVTLDQLMGRHRCAELELSFECSLGD